MLKSVLMEVRKGSEVERERYECETEKHEMERVRYETEVLHSGRGSTKNFARRIVFHMINPEILMRSNCHGKTNKTSGRKRDVEECVDGSEKGE